MVSVRNSFDRISYLIYCISASTYLYVMRAFLPMWSNVFHSGDGKITPENDVSSISCSDTAHKKKMNFLFFVWENENWKSTKWRRNQWEHVSIELLENMKILHERRRSMESVSTKLREQALWPFLCDVAIAMMAYALYKAIDVVTKSYGNYCTRRAVQRLWR